MVSKEEFIDLVIKPMLLDLPSDDYSMTIRFLKSGRVSMEIESYGDKQLAAK